jgi:hypothetical protein
MTERAHTESLDYASRRIKQLVQDIIKDEDVCPCCIARALLFNGACLLENMAGSIEVAESFEAMVATMRENPMPAPAPDWAQ